MGILSRRHGDVLELALDWPAKRNALGPDEANALRRAIDDAGGDESLGAVVLSASGGAFCAGGNLPEILRLAADGADSVRTAIYGAFQGVFRAIAACPVPVITAVDGGAIGFGCDLAVAGQATFMGEKAWLAQGWAKAGLIPATGGMLHVARRAGPQAVWRLLATERVDAKTAEAWGLAIAADDALAAALSMGKSLCSLPRGPVRAMVQLSGVTDMEAHLEAALNHQIGFITHPDFATFANALLLRART